MAIARDATSPWSPDFHELRGLVTNPTGGDEHGPVATRLWVPGEDGRPYLPIERFRDDPGVIDSFPMGSADRIFRSSGTTGASRATSPYSRGGLDAYRISSVYHFLYAAAAAMGSTPTEVLATAKLVSLVPPPSEWPDSSLAAMIAWIGDLIGTTYVGAFPRAKVTTLREAVAQAGGRPVWLFGTAFHLVNAMDDGTATALPQGSLVIETGGTKGKSRQVSREDFYQELVRHFALPLTGIVSEYGMSELASQAYDFATPPPNSKHERSFRWPAWVKTDVVRTAGTALPHGVGGLRIFDPLRLDLPWAIRTEDLAAVEEDGSMRLLGRLPVAPLKGCSLDAERVVAPKGTAPRAALSSEKTAALKWDPDEVAGRAATLAPAWEHWLASASTLASLAREIGSTNAASAAIKDLARSSPSNAKAWVSAVSRAVGNLDGAVSAATKVRSRWLTIAPENHSLVALYPAALAYVAGLRMTVRVPRRFSGDLGLLNSALAMLTSLPDSRVASISADYRVGDETVKAFDGIVAYGSDETVEAIASAAPAAVIRAFGNRMGMSIMRAGNQEDANLTIRDALSLGQSGCMASRLVVAVCTEKTSLLEQREEMDETLRQLAEAGSAFWAAPLPSGFAAALDCERSRLLRRGFTSPFWPLDSEPLVLGRQATVGDLGLATALMADAALRPFTIPTVFVKGATPLVLVKMAADIARRTSTLGTVTIPASWREGQDGVSPANFSVATPSFRCLGDANAPLWDGTHEGRPFFTPD